MIPRYEHKLISALWKDEARLDLWKMVESLVALGWSEQKLFDHAVASEITAAKIDIKRMLEIEERTRHDVTAFIEMISEQLSSEARRWIHFGLTSTDIVDTAQNKLLALSADVIINLAERFSEVLLTRINETKDVFILARTHGMNAELTTVAHKLSGHHDELMRAIVSLKEARENINVAKISGSVGNYMNIPRKIEIYVAKEMKMGTQNHTTQVTPRDRHATLIFALAKLAGASERFALNIRLSHQSGIEEIKEGYAKGQKGSSSMPHKKNPITCENICGLARMVRHYVPLALENNLLWNERDISHSSNERIMFGDVFHLLATILERSITVANELVIDKERIAQNISALHETYLSQQLMNYILTTNKNLTRIEVHTIMQLLSERAKQSGKPLLKLAAEESKFNFIAGDFAKFLGTK